MYTKYWAYISIGILIMGGRISFFRPIVIYSTQCLSNNYMKARYLNQFVSEMLDSWKWNSTGCALQYEIINYFTIATYWGPDLPKVRACFGFLWLFILIFSHYYLIFQIQQAYKCIRYSTRPGLMFLGWEVWERVCCLGNTISLHMKLCHL